MQVREILYSDEAADADESQLLQPDYRSSFVEHSLFVQLDVLCHFDDDDSIGWKEMARYRITHKNRKASLRHVN